SCIALLGEEGCGFERQFGAITRALGADGHPAPAENQGFLRPDAYLAVVMITNEDDCSALPGVNFYDTTTNLTLDSKLGPPGTFRCTECAHPGAAARPSRLAPGGDPDAQVTYTTCTSNDAGGYLLGVADTAARLRALKRDPDHQILVAALTGPSSPYTV